MNNIQAMMSGMSAQWQKERSESQMTLGKLIETLAAMPPEMELEGFGEAHSYRGYYSDLAFKKMEQKTTASKALEMARVCMGEVFTGYKGGDFQMGSNTPVWIANYGACGMKIMAIRDDGTLELAEDSF
jgi:hypothetical protein